MQEAHTSAQPEPSSTQPLTNEFGFGPYDRRAPYTPPPAPSPQRNYKAWVVIALLGTLVVLMAIVQAAYKFRSRSIAAELPAAPSHAASNGPSPVSLSSTFRNVAKAVKPAVVYIQVTERQSGQGFLPMFPFGARPQQASGSGVIVQPDGYILTNNHVVGNADRIAVTLADGRKFTAEKIGTDPASDLAVIKIPASGLPYAVLGDSSAVEQGDWVLAIGSPFDLQQTITAGIVSATGRTLAGGGASRLDRYIQTDASINPGNSGGPLVNMNNEVIGINTLIYSPSQMQPGPQGFNVGIGFAIPSSEARRVYEQLVKTGKVERGYLGVTIRDLDEPAARSNGVELNSGALIDDVTGADSPAAKAGLQSGDVVTSVDGHKVTSAAELTDEITAMPVGHQARVEFIRNGKHESATVTLTERPAEETARAGAPPQDQGESSDESEVSKLGLNVTSITPPLASQLQLRIAGGAYIVSAEPYGAAANAGLQKGDVIHRLGSTEIKSANDLIRAAKDLKSGEDVSVQVEHEHKLYFITITID